MLNGLILSTQLPLQSYIIFKADGLIDNDSILEIKCLFSARISPVMTLNESDKVKTDSSGGFCFSENNATSRKYYHQI